MGAPEGQTSFRSLADYLAPVESGLPDYLGAFAVTAGVGAEELAATFEADHDDYNGIMTKALADRLAEAFAELLHARVRRDWGYGRDGFAKRGYDRGEIWGIRPAAGYPSCPDHTEKATLWQCAERGGVGRHSPHRELRDDAGGVGEQPLLRPPGGDVLRGGSGQRAEIRWRIMPGGRRCRAQEVDALARGKFVI